MFCQKNSNFFGKDFYNIIHISLKNTWVDSKIDTKSGNWKFYTDKKSKENFEGTKTKN